MIPLIRVGKDYREKVPMVVPSYEFTTTTRNQWASRRPPVKVVKACTDRSNFLYSERSIHCGHLSVLFSKRRNEKIWTTKQSKKRNKSFWKICSSFYCIFSYISFSITRDTKWTVLARTIMGLNGGWWTFSSDLVPEKGTSGGSSLL